jgi:hypothetical protein
MKLREFPLLTDENLDSDVVASLRLTGFDVLDVVESGLQGSADVDLLRLAAAQGRVVVTHDADYCRARDRPRPWTARADGWRGSKHRREASSGDSRSSSPRQGCTPGMPAFAT